MIEKRRRRREGEREGGREGERERTKGREGEIHVHVYRGRKGERKEKVKSVKKFLCH